jgi:hypothetical protein
MTTSTVQEEPVVGADAATPAGAPPDGRSRTRFVRAVVVALVAVGIPYLWILWDLWTGTADPLRAVSPSNFYDLQGHAMLSGHLYVPAGSLGIEAFLNGGHQYTYFGIFPSLIRLPVLALTHSFDGRLTAPSMLAAWIVTGILTSLLLWRVRIQIRGEAVVGVAEAVCCGILVAAVNGSVLLYLAATPKVSHEDLAWSVALTVGALFALVGVAERPSGRRMALAALFVVCAALDRSPTGYACILATFLLAAWFALGRSGPDTRRRAVPLTAIAVGALALGGLVDWAKLGMPFGLSEANQVWTQINAHRRLYLASNGGNAFALHYLPSTLVAYLQPAGISVSAHFPFLSLPTGPARAVGAVVLDQTYPTASVPASWPLLFLLGVWGVVTAFRPRPVGRVQPLRLLLVATAAGTAGVLLFGYIADRYLADFLPFFALAAMIGMVDVWRRLDGRGRRARSAVVAVVAVVGAFGLWVNIGAAVTPSALWTATQAKGFVAAQRSLGGTPTVERGATLPYWAPAGTLFATGDCSGLYVSSGFDYATVPGEQLEHETWDTVQGPADSSHSLEVTWNGPITAGGRPATIATYGTTRVELEPVGTDRVRLTLRGPDLADLSFPPTTTAPVTMEPGRPYGFTIVTDPELHSIEVGGIGVGLQYPLPGSGPFAPGTGPEATVVARTPATAPDDLCRQLTGSARRR